jgi:hypothetical protein
MAIEWSAVLGCVELAKRGIGEIQSLRKLVLALTGSNPLDELKHDVRLLVQGPFNAGLVYLQDAAEPNGSVKHRRQCIQGALDKFTDAMGIQFTEQSLARAYAAVYRGICWILLGSDDMGEKWLRDGFHYGLTYTEQLIAEDSKEDSRGAAYSMGGLAGLIGGIATMFVFPPAAAILMGGGIASMAKGSVGSTHSEEIANGKGFLVALSQAMGRLAIPVHVSQEVLDYKPWEGFTGSSQLGNGR